MTTRNRVSSYDARYFVIVIVLVIVIELSNDDVDTPRQPNIHKPVAPPLSSAHRHYIREAATRNAELAWDERTPRAGPTTHGWTGMGATVQRHKSNAHADIVHA